MKGVGGSWRELEGLGVKALWETSAKRTITLELKETPVQSQTPAAILIMVSMEISWERRRPRRHYSRPCRRGRRRSQALRS